jgi:hypothetical protein
MIYNVEETVYSWAVIEVLTDHRGEYSGSQRIAVFSTQAEAVEALDSMPPDKERDCIVVEVRGQWNYFLPDGRRFDPELGDWISKYL